MKIDFVFGEGGTHNRAQQNEAGADATHQERPERARNGERL